MTQPLPNFFIVGAMKSGTTSLYHYLSSHPEVYLSPIKEPHYFCRDINPDEFDPAYQVEAFDMERYIADGMTPPQHHAYIRNWQHYQALFAPATDQKAIGEASPSYLYSQQAAQEIRQQFPAAKIIIILREPVARAYSHYRMDKEIGRTQDSFWQALQQDSQHSKKWGQNSLYIELGYYVEQVQRYFDCFPAEQIKILWFDDLQKNRDQLLRELADFLGIAADGFTFTEEAHNQSRSPRFAALNYWLHRLGLKQLLRKLLPQTLLELGKRVFYHHNNKHPDEHVLECLSNLYDSEVKKLARLLNKDLSAWLARYQPYLSHKQP